MIASLAGGELFAAEYHGAVQFAGLPVPGVTLKATLGDNTLATSTDESGAFSFGDLPDGIWAIEIEMLGFEEMTRQVSVSPAAPAALFELKIVTQQALLATLNPHSSANPTPPVATRPEAAENRARYRQLDVNQSTSPASFGNDGAIKTEEVATFNQSAANSFLVQGSTSSALGLPQQNDWGIGGPGGMPGPGGLSGPAMGMGGPMVTVPVTPRKAMRECPAACVDPAGLAAPREALDRVAALAEDQEAQASDLEAPAVPVEDQAGLADGPHGRDVQAPWRSATIVAIRETAIWPAPSSAWITPHSTPAVSQSPAPTWRSLPTPTPARD